MLFVCLASLKYKKMRDEGETLGFLQKKTRGSPWLCVSGTKTLNACLLIGGTK